MGLRRRRWWELRRRREDGFVHFSWDTIQRGWMVRGCGGPARPATADEVSASCNEGY